MCGRYTLTRPPVDFARRLGVDPAELDELAALPPRFNIAPGQLVAAITNLSPRRAELLSWGLVPSWARDPRIGHRLINARAETAAQKPSFRNALRRRRCAVLADGFYEWLPAGRLKIPHYIRRKDHAPFAFAGLWESWHHDEQPPLRSCTILTTSPNEVLAPIHDRMPVILDPANLDRWLDPAARDGADFADLLHPAPAQDWEAFPVSTRVNRPSHDAPDCIESAAGAAPTS